MKNILAETSFMRILGNKNYTFKNNKLVLLTIKKLAKYILPLIRVKALTNKFITMDIETFIKDGVHIPYTIC
jgi:hypothetical protein